MKKERNLIKNLKRSSFEKHSLLISRTKKKRILSASNSVFLSRKKENKTNKSYNHSSVASASASKIYDAENRKSLIFNKIKKYKMEQNKRRPISCYPTRRRDFVYESNFLNEKKIPSHLNVINLILNKSSNQINVNLLENKINRLAKLSDLNKLNSSTRKKLFEYNIIYGYNSNNIIKSYSTKLTQHSSEIKKNIDKEENLQVFSEEQIRELFYQKCRDLNVPIKEELMNRFTNFIKEKCVNRIINLSDCSLGLNSMIILADILRRNINICSRLILTKNYFGDDGIEILLESLKGNDNIVELNLCSNSLGINGGIALFNFLLYQKSIICIDLSSKEGLYRNRVCAEGIRLITKVLQNNFFLEKIDLSSNSIKNEGFKYIVNGLVSNITLKTLIIHNNEITEKGIAYFETKSVNCKLKILDISRNPIGNNGIISLGNCIARIQLKEITSLDISECLFTFESFFIFIKKISKAQKIETLVANKNNLSSNGRWHLLDDFFKRLPLKSLSLGSCHLNHDIKEIADIFKINSTIKFLDLSHNNITDEFFEYFQTYPLENLSLEEFDVSSNYISDKSASVFFKNLIDNYTLIKLNFFDNHLENASADAIIDILRKNNYILSLNVNCNNIGIKVLQEIKEKIQNNKMMKKGRYVPKLRNELKCLEFNPSEVKLLKNKIINVNKEAQYLYKKYIEEVKVLENKKKHNLKDTKTVNFLQQKIEKNLNIIEYESKKIKEDEIRENQEFEEKMDSLKKNIDLLKIEIEEINNIKGDLKFKYNEEIGLLKSTYNETLQKEEINKLDIKSIKSDLLKMKKLYEQKYKYLEKLKSSISLNIKNKNSDLKFISNNIIFK